MKTKKLTPRNMAPVQRENTSTISRDGKAVTPNGFWVYGGVPSDPFAGDDAE